MITQKQIKIFSVFAKNAFKEYTFKELKAASNEKSHSVLQNAIAKFKREDIISEKKIGALKQYSLNFECEAVYGYLQVAFSNMLPPLAEKAVNMLKAEIEKYTSFYSLVVFGSHANQTNTEKSDLDLAILLPDKTQETNINICLNKIMNRSLVEIDAHIITQDDFLEMLYADYENLGKQIARKNMPVHNPAIFYGLIRRGVAHGFKH